MREPSQGHWCFSSVCVCLCVHDQGGDVLIDPSSEIREGHGSMPTDVVRPTSSTLSTMGMRLSVCVRVCVFMSANEGRQHGNMAYTLLSTRHLFICDFPLFSIFLGAFRRKRTVNTGKVKHSSQQGCWFLHMTQEG
jgi:hypothetical protein